MLRATARSSDLTVVVCDSVWRFSPDCNSCRDFADTTIARWRPALAVHYRGNLPGPGVVQNRRSTDSAYGPGKLPEHISHFSQPVPFRAGVDLLSLRLHTRRSRVPPERAISHRPERPHLPYQRSSNPVMARVNQQVCRRSNGCIGRLRRPGPAWSGRRGPVSASSAPVSGGPRPAAVLRGRRVSPARSSGATS